MVQHLTPLEARTLTDLEAEVKSNTGDALSLIEEAITDLEECVVDSETLEAIRLLLKTSWLALDNADRQVA